MRRRRWRWHARRVPSAIEAHARLRQRASTQAASCGRTPSPESAPRRKGPIELRVHRPCGEALCHGLSTFLLRARFLRLSRHGVIRRKNLARSAWRAMPEELLQLNKRALLPDALDELLQIAA